MIYQAHIDSGLDKAMREAEQSEALIRKVTMLEGLGCFDEAGMENLWKGKVPTITKGPHARELPMVGQIISLSVSPELDNCHFNLEFMPESLIQSREAKIGEKEVGFAKKWRKRSILSEEGFEAFNATAGE